MSSLGREAHCISGDRVAHAYFTAALWSQMFMPGPRPPSAPAFLSVHCLKASEQTRRARSSYRLVYRSAPTSSFLWLSTVQDGWHCATQTAVAALIQVLLLPLPQKNNTGLTHHPFLSPMTQGTFLRTNEWRTEGCAVWDSVTLTEMADRLLLIS